ncbi:MAG TPA: Rid family hydrolase [Gaiellales bacterium]|jgi:enamine deaminase RidA (YjgF/YER057c/UK114 family)
MEPDPRIALVRPHELTTTAPYAYAALPPAGAVAPGDVAAQAEQVMANLRAALRAAGADLDDVLKTTVHVATVEVEAVAAVR